MTLIYLSTAWMSGIYVAQRVALPLLLWGVLALLPATAAWFWRQNPRARLAALCGLFLCLGATRHALARPRFDEHSVAAHNDQGWVTLTGIVAAEPDVRDTYVNLRLRAETLSVGDSAPVAVEGLVLVRAPRYPEHVYGDSLEVRGLLETPPVFEGFSYKDYLARQGVYSLMRWARVSTVARGRGNALLRFMLAFKRHVQGVIATVLPEPAAALLTGILLGVETGIPRSLAADFSLTGTSHIIAISGFNIALISGLISRLSVRLAGRRYAAWFSTAAIALYTLFVGASAAVVRAAVMGSIAVWGEHFGRQNASANALFGTALLMTLWNPHTLWDLGFLLSFAATLGLIVLADPLQQRFSGLLARMLPAGWVEGTAGFLNESLVLTTCAQLTTLPIVIYTWGTLSVVTLLSNLLILPAQPQVMLWGALSTVGGLVWLPAGRVLGWVAWFFLSYTIWAVEWTARLPHAAVELRSARLVVVWGWYALLGAAAWWMGQPHERRRALWQSVRAALRGHLKTKVVIGGLAVVAVLVWSGVYAMPDGKLHVTVLDVGQGDAVYIETPLGRQILVNGGPSGTATAAHLGQRMAFWDRSLDVVVLTDQREEHLVGLVPVLERYAVDHFWQWLPEDRGSAAYEQLQEAAREQGLVTGQPGIGTRMDMGDGVVVTVLHAPDVLPGEEGRLASDDVAVLRVDYGQTCLLLAASAGAKAERAMLAYDLPGVRCDVLQVGRHGSEAASTPAFLEAVRPALAVVSAGEGNRAGDPDERTLARLSEVGAMVVRTDEVGSVEVISDGVGVQVRVGR